MKAESAEVVMDRRRKSDRRRDSDRRTDESPVANEERKAPRRKVQRRRQIDPTTCERDYSADEIEFMRALDEYKRASGRMFPTCSEVLEVIRSLGYQKASPVDETTEAAGDSSDEPNVDNPDDPEVAGHAEVPAIA